MDNAHPPARADILPSQPGQGEFLEQLLTGSHKKTAYALRQNAERMIKEAPGGLGSIGFFTLTVGDYEWGPVAPGAKRRFIQVWDSTEANRRINNLRRFLLTVFERWIIVTERHKTGAIHFHLLGVLRGAPDIRTGFDWDAVKRRDYSTVPQKLRDLWALLRKRLPGYGFGRAELMPVRKTGEAVSKYIAKYIEKTVCNRRPEDKRKKLVRYGGDWSEITRMRPNEFSWANKRASAWRCKTRQLAALVGVYFQSQAAEAFGPRWAFQLTRLWQGLGDNLNPYLVWTYRQRETMRRELVKLAHGWAQREENRQKRRASYRPDYLEESEGSGFPVEYYGRQYRDLGRTAPAFDWDSPCLRSLVLPDGANN